MTTVIKRRTLPVWARAWFIVWSHTTARKAKARFTPKWIRKTRVQRVHMTVRRLEIAKENWIDEKMQCGKLPCKIYTKETSIYIAMKQKLRQHVLVITVHIQNRKHRNNRPWKNLSLWNQLHIQSWILYFNMFHGNLGNVWTLLSFWHMWIQMVENHS